MTGPYRPRRYCPEPSEAACDERNESDVTHEMFLSNLHGAAAMVHTN
jgi:hypothetical protein